MAQDVTIKSRLTPIEKARLEAKRAELEVEEKYRKQISGTPFEKKQKVKEEELPQYKPPSRSASLSDRIRHASDWTGETKLRIESAIDFIAEGQIIDVRDMKILQAGWPETFGTPPEIDPKISDFHNDDRVVKNFKRPDIEKIRKVLLKEITIEERVKESDVPKVLKKNFEQAIKATGATIERIWESLDAIKRGWKLTALDVAIIKAGWPEMIDAKGRVKEADWEQAVRIAMKNIQVSRKRVEEAVHKVNTFRKLVELDQKILQAGWPQVYGVSGTPFKKGRTIDNAPYSLGGGPASKAAIEERRRKIQGIEPAYKKDKKKKKETTEKEKVTEAKKEKTGLFGKETAKEDIKKKGYPTGFKVVREEGVIFPEKDVLVYVNEPALTKKQIKDLTPEWILDREKPEVEPLYDPNADQLYEAIKFWLHGGKYGGRYTKQQFEYAKKHPKEKIFQMPFLTKEQWKDVEKRHPVYYSVLKLLRTGKFSTDERIERLKTEREFVTKHDLPLEREKFKTKFFDTFEKYEDGKRLTKDDMGILQFYDPKKFGSFGEKFKDPRKKDIKDVLPIGSKDEVAIAIKKSKVEYARLSDREKEILQSNFPKIFGIPGEKFKKQKDRFTDYAKRAMEATGRNMKEVVDAIERAREDRFVRTKDKEILQSGWPHVFGKVGEHFKQGGHQFIPEVLPPDASWDKFKQDWFIDNWFPGELKKQEKRIKDSMERMNKRYVSRFKRFLVLHFLVAPIMHSPMSLDFETRNEFIARIEKQINWNHQLIKEQMASNKFWKKYEKELESVSYVYIPKESVDYIKHGGTPPRVFEPNQKLVPFKISDIDKYVNPDLPSADSLYDKYLQGWPDKYSEHEKIKKDSDLVRKIQSKIFF